MAVKENLKEIIENINKIKEKNNITREIQLIAVSKTMSADKVKEAIDAGHLDFGENRVQEGIEKIEKINDDRVTWHLIGHLQSNKASKAVRNFNFIHSVDRIKIADKIQNFCEQYEKQITVLIEVNTSGEESKYGCKPEETEKLAKHILTSCKNLQLKGLMTVGPLYGGNKGARESFQKLNSIKLDLADKLGNEYMEFLSMGMSGDYEIAIEEGATHLRIGTAIFGERNT